MKSIHFVGVGGIGMSGLAAAAADLGFEVSGSDRAANRPENRALFSALASQGVVIYPQDGSRYASGNMPDMLVYSTAIEEDNPDFKGATGVSRMHRAELLGFLLDRFGRKSIAVTGSCGKSTVSCYLTEALCNAGSDPVMLAGALAKRFRTPGNAGNYRSGKGEYLVFEADESDKSLLKYGADYAMILNIGTDHYDKAELVDVFARFLHSIRLGAVMTSEVYEALQGKLPPDLPVSVVYPDFAEGEKYTLQNYTAVAGSGAKAVFAGSPEIALPANGRHSAVNALCIKAMMEMLGFEAQSALEALCRFEGVWRRDDFAGKNSRGAMVFDDYAHNPEKILSCLRGMRERVNGRIFAVFQPHGYGPFGFMENTLFEYMDKFLSVEDRFIVMEPYYAGGTSSFSPKAVDVVAKWQSCAACGKERFMTMPDRETLSGYLDRETGADDIIVIMGARDNSLSDYAASLTVMK